MEITAEDSLVDETIANEKLANVWARLGAYVIDVIFITSINGIILSPLKFATGTIPMEWGFWTTLGTMSALTYYIYFFFATKLFSKTLGKMIFGIKVISTNKAQPSWGDIFFRELIGRFIHNIFNILKLLYIYILVSEEKQGFHDVIGNTLVVVDKK